MLITNATLQALRTNVSKIYGSAHTTAEPKLEPTIATRVTSNTAIKTYGWMAKIPAFRQWVGPRQIQNLSEYAAQITNLDYELTVGVDQNEIEDDNLDIFTMQVSEMGRQARLLPDQLLKTALQAGTSGLAFDGVAFFSAAGHALSTGNTIQNLFTSTALTPANYALVRETMMSYLDADGEPIGVDPDTMIVPPALEREGKMILMAESIPDPGGVVTSVTNIHKGSAKLVVDARLANQPTVWYLADTSKGIKPLIMQVRKEPQLVAKTQPTDDNVFTDRKYVWGSHFRGAAGYGPFFLMARAAA